MKGGMIGIAGRDAGCLGRGAQKGERAWAPGGQIWTEGGGGVPLVDVRAETKEVASVSHEKQRACPRPDFVFGCRTDCPRLGDL